MKALLTVTTLCSGGIGSYLITLAEGLRTRGWEVCFLTTNSRGNEFEKINKQFICHDLSALPLSYRKVTAASKVIHDVRPDILLINHCSLIHYVLPFLDSAIKPVAVLHSEDRRYFEAATLFSRRVFRWIAPSSGVAERCKHFIKEDMQYRIRVIPHGIRSDIFFPSRKDNSNDHRKKITFVGYIDKNKGADLLPEIFGRVSFAYPALEFSIVGYGPMRNSLEDHFASLGIKDKCNFSGLLGMNEVAETLRNTDVLLLPTRIEGFGLSIVEAMMSGAIPVVSRLEGITDSLVENNRTGFLITPEDTVGFAGAIVYLLKNPEKLKSMSKAAHAAARENFSSARMIDSYELLFAENDDRGLLTRRTMFGWALETLRELTKKDVEGKRSFKKISGAAKRIWDMRKTA